MCGLILGIIGAFGVASAALSGEVLSTQTVGGLYAGIGIYFVAALVVGFFFSKTVGMATMPVAFGALVGAVGLLLQGEAAFALSFFVGCIASLVIGMYCGAILRSRGIAF